MKTVFVATRHCLIYNTQARLGMAACLKGAEAILAAAQADAWTLHNEWSQANPSAADGMGLDRYEWTIEEEEIAPCTCS